MSEQALRNMPGLFKSSYEVLKQNFRIIGTIQLVNACISFVFSVLIEQGLSLSPLTTGILFIILLLPLSWGTAASLYVVKHRQEAVSVREAFAKTRTDFIQLWGISMLSGIAVGVGFIFLIIPGVILAVWFSLSIEVLIGENKRGFEAIKTSKEYVRGRFDYVFGQLFGLGCLSVLYFIFSVVMAVIFSKVFGINPIFGSVTVALIVSTLISSIVDIFLAGFSCVFLYLLYERLRDTKTAPVAETIVS